MRTVTHVTHEAVHKVGGIGAVLQGLMTSAVYQREIGRTFLVAPFFSSQDESRVAQEGEILYSSISGVGGRDIGRKLDGIVQKYNVNLVYGRRRLTGEGGGAEAQAEVLLVDPTHINRRLEDNFKFNLYKKFGLQSERYEAVDDYLLYLRIAEPAFDALRALTARGKGPHFVLAHEYMGMPLALKSILADAPRFRTIFYAHEVATVRPLVENASGHDTMFYNAMGRALEAGLSVSDVFGDQSGFYKHALIERAHFCDGIFAVGDLVVDELRFLGPAFRGREIDLVYNGLPAVPISLDERLASREMLQQYGQNLLGVRPDTVFTHVTRPVVSKGVWRDLRVLEHLDGMFEARGRKGVFFLLSTAAGPRAPEDVARMESEYGWPVAHRVGAPDLVGTEVDFWRAVAAYNLRAEAIQAIFINQFGWDRTSCGVRMPEEMSFADLRRGTDVEFGASIYEPFGIAPLEPLGFGALCVISSVCGCRGFVTHAAGDAGAPNVMVADFVSLPDAAGLDDAMRIDEAHRDAIERARSLEAAHEILARLPMSDADREAALQQGYQLASHMSWDRVCEKFLLPGLARAEG